MATDFSLTPTPLVLTDVQLDIIARAEKNLRSRGWPFREMVDARLAALDADEIDDEAVDFAAREVVRHIRDRDRR